LVRFLENAPSCEVGLGVFWVRPNDSIKAIKGILPSTLAIKLDAAMELPNKVGLLGNQRVASKP
jgi:hypothetical protein